MAHCRTLMSANVITTAGAQLRLFYHATGNEQSVRLPEVARVFSGHVIRVGDYQQRRKSEPPRLRCSSRHGKQHKTEITSDNWYDVRDVAQQPTRNGMILREFHAFVEVTHRWRTTVRISRKYSVVLACDSAVK